MGDAEPIGGQGYYRVHYSGDGVPVARELSTCPECGARDLGARQGMNHAAGCATALKDCDGLVSFIERLEPCGVCGSTCDVHDSAAHRAFYKGREAEREDVVAWIRAQGGTVADIPRHTACEHGQYSTTGCEQCGLAATADAIERGDHHA